MGLDIDKLQNCPCHGLAEMHSFLKCLITLKYTYSYIYFIAIPDMKSRPAEINEESWELLTTLYENPNEIDLYTGGLAETKLDGNLHIFNTPNDMRRENLLFLLIMAFME